MVQGKEQVVKKKTIYLTGEVIAADTETAEGKILIFENDQIQEDIYTFKLNENLPSRKLFKKFFLREVKVTCLQEPITNFFEKIEKAEIDLKIIDIKLF